MTFEQWMERSGVTAPDPDDEIAGLGYVDQVCAWAAEHDPEGLARWEESLALSAARDVLDRAVNEGMLTWEIDWDRGEVTYRRRGADDEGEAR